MMIVISFAASNIPRMGHLTHKSCAIDNIHDRHIPSQMLALQDSFPLGIPRSHAKIPQGNPQRLAYHKNVETPRSFKNRNML
jgi:hypothetical protein